MAVNKFNTSHPAYIYAQRLISGEIPCCLAEKQLAKKHVKDLKRQKTKKFPYIFDESRAQRYINFFEICKNPDTNEYYKALPHQVFEYSMLYGWVNAATGIRKYSTVYKQESRGGAKTTGCAVMAMYGLCSDKVYPPGKPELGYVVPNASILLMAVDKIQAEELREPIVVISKASPKLLHRIDARNTFIRGKKYGGQIKVLSKDVRNKQGGKPNLIIIDEYGSHPNDKRAEAAKKGLGKKAQGMVYMITTAGDNEETNPAKKEYDYAKKVLSGEIVEESYLPIIRETEPNDDIHDPETWQKSNPMFRYCEYYDYSKTLFDTVSKEHKRAFEGQDLEKQREFKIYRLNMWQERAVQSYLSADLVEKFKKLAVSREEFDRLTYGRMKTTGLDFSIRRDLTADGDVFLLPDGRIAIDAHGYMLSECVKERELSDKQPYTEWAKQGWLTIMDYPAMNKRIVAEDFITRADEKEQEIKEIAYDYFNAKDLVMDLQDGIYGGQFSEENCIMIPQDVKHLHLPTKQLRESIICGNIVWNGNPLLLWCLMNAFEFKTTHGELIKIMKEHKESPRRIDLAAAVINALARVDSLKENNLVDRILEGGYGF